MALLFAELDDAWSRGEDEGAVFAELDKLHRTVNASAMREQGAVVKIHGDGVMAALPDPDAAMRAALALREQAPGHVRCVVHAGPAMMTTINDRLDYFGKVVKQASDLLTATSAGGLCVAEPVLTDAGVRERLESYRGRGQVLQHAGQVAWILPAGE